VTSSERRCRVLVVGTSNAVRKGGFADFLSRIVDMTNASIGASTSVHSIHSTRDIDFSDYDYCILDFCANEEVRLRAGVATWDSISPIVESLICRATAAKCLPVILILPRLIHDQPKTRDLYVELAERHGLPYFDGYELLAKLEARGVIKQAMFADSAHNQDWVAAIIAEILAAGLQTLEPHWREAPWRAGRFATVALPAQGGDFEIVQRATSRFSGEFIRLNGPQTIAIPNLSGEAIIGLRLNLAQTNCFLRINDAVVDLRTEFWNVPKKPVVIAALLLSPAIGWKDGEDGVMTLETMTAPDPSRPVLIASEGGHPHSGPVTGEVEIAEIFVRLAEDVESLYKADALVPLLHEGVENLIRLGVSVYRAVRPEEADAEEARKYAETMRERRALRDERRRRAAPALAESLSQEQQ